MSKIVKLSVLGATSVVLCLAAPIGGGSALAGSNGLAASNDDASPAATKSAADRRQTTYGDRSAYHPGRRRNVVSHAGRSAYCPPPRPRRCYDECSDRSAYVEEEPVIVERRAVYVAAPVVAVAAVPVVAAYPAYGYPSGYGYPYSYGYGGPGIVGAGLLGGFSGVGYGGWGAGWGGWGW